MKYSEKMYIEENEQIAENFKEIEFFLNTMRKRLWGKKDRTNDQNEKDSYNKELLAICRVRNMLYSVSLEVTAEHETQELEIRLGEYDEG